MNNTQAESKDYREGMCGRKGEQKRKNGGDR